MYYLALFIIGLMSFSANAFTTVNVYQVDVELDQAQSNPEQAARIQGMKEVIIRVTGHEDALDNAVIKKALLQPNSYLNQISRSQRDQQTWMHLLFNRPQIRALLNQAQLPFWSENRANILVWLVDGSGYERQIAWQHAELPLLMQLKVAAKQRGLPITIPIGDFDDVTGIEVSDLWGGFSQAISQASMRYATDAILVIRAQSGQLNWNLYDQSAKAMMTRGQSPVQGKAVGEQAIVQLVDQLSQYYANKHQQNRQDTHLSSIMVSVNGLPDAQVFFDLEQQLVALNIVASAQLKSIQGDQVMFQVELLGDPLAFEQEILANPHLRKSNVNDRDSESESITAWSYTWQL